MKIYFSGDFFLICVPQKGIYLLKKIQENHIWTKKLSIAVNLKPFLPLIPQFLTF